MGLESYFRVDVRIPTATGFSTPTESFSKFPAVAEKYKHTVLAGRRGLIIPIWRHFKI